MSYLEFADRFRQSSNYRDNFTWSELAASEAIANFFKNSANSSDDTTIYRFFNSNSGVHFYTANEIEREAVEELPNYIAEGEAFFAYQTEVEGSIPIYRFYNSSGGAHFYTPSAVEKNSIEATLPDFELEGIAYYAFPLAQQ